MTEGHPVLVPPRSQWALFLDVDGALLDLQPTPAHVVAPRHVRLLMERALLRLDGAMALLSGRSIDDLDRIFYPLKLPAAGVHGGERRSTDGTCQRIPVDLDFLAEARVALADFARRHVGVLLEDKGIALALHTRKAPGARTNAEAVVRTLAERSAGCYSVQIGKEVFELKPHAANKGRALGEFMAEPAFQRRRPVVTGDDRTDADAFAEANRLNGVSIAIGPDAPPANFHLASPEQCRRWLAAWLA